VRQFDITSMQSRKQDIAPDVGSSSSRIFGSVTREHPIVTLRIWPPDIPRWIGVPMRLFRISVRPRPRMVMETRLFMSLTGVDGGRLWRLVFGLSGLWQG
jgi:hypothetical protein